MKALIFSIALLASTGALAQVYVMPNEGGGEITLTSRPCNHKGTNYAGLKEAYTWSNQLYVSGCWAVVDGNVHIVWNIGDRSERRVYSINSFSPR